jgi:hypothetical protein
MVHACAPISVTGPWGSLTSFLRKVIVIILVDDLVGNLMAYFLVLALTYSECARHAHFKAFDMQN